MNDERLELIVDNEDTYIDVDNVFYMNPNRLSLLRCVSDSQFVSCTIKNTTIDCLSSINFSYILRKLKPNANCEIIICQPITVMQMYDAKQVEANAKLAGFTKFEISEFDFVDSKTDMKFKTLAVTFVKPVKEEREVYEIKRLSSVSPGKNNKPIDKKSSMTNSNKSKN